MVSKVMRRRAARVAAIVLFVWATQCAAQAASPQIVVQAVKATHVPGPEDVLWDSAVKAAAFTNVTVRKPAVLPTTAYILYDDQNVYVKFSCDQPGVPITANQLTDNVGFGLDDYVSVSLDTTGQSAQIYNFYVTPAGVRYQDASESARYDPPWSASAWRFASGHGWAATMTIPLVDLRSSSVSTKGWRVNFRRHVAATREDLMWVYNPNASNQSGDSSFWPMIVGFQLPIRATRPLPRAAIYGLESVGSARTQFQDQFGNFQSAPVRVAGADLSYPLTNTLAAVATVDPDFSNIEVDQQVITPQQFPRYFYEYRPFFAQGADYLSPKEINVSISTGPTSVFYSPSIGRFDEGLKLEGTIGNLGLGVLQAAGPNFDDLVFGAKESLYGQQLKYWVDGVSANHADTGKDVTLEAGAAYRNSRSGLLGGVNVASETGSMAIDGRQATLSELTVGTAKDAFSFFLVRKDIGPEYNPVDGYNALNDLHGMVASGTYNGVAPETSILKTYSVNLGADRYTDTAAPGHTPAVHLADAFESASVTFRNLLSINVGNLNSEQRYYDVGYPVYGGGATYPFRQTSISLGYRDGTQSPSDISYSFGPFGEFTLYQYDASIQRLIKPRLSVGLEVAQTFERYPQRLLTQQLYRGSLALSVSRQFNVSLAIRSIEGSGGFAVPGTDVSFGLHRRTAHGNDLYIDYGSPAAMRTLNRLLVKYVVRFGGGEGT